MTCFLPASHSEEIINPFEIDNPTLSISNLLNKINTVSKDIPGWFLDARADAIASLVLNTRPKICVEIGVFGGTSLIPIAMTLKFLKSGRVYAVDSWNNNDSIKYMTDDDPNKMWWSTLPLNDTYKNFIRTLKTNKLMKYCTVYKEDSINAASHFKDNSIDLLHWDGNHTFLGAQKEFRAYLPKVKIGGYILVNDINWSVADKLPIQLAADVLFESCELIDSLYEGNIYLFKKL